MIGLTRDKKTRADDNRLHRHADTDITRTDARRTQSCPGTWKNGHHCPEQDQPLVVPAPFNNGGRTVETGGFVGHALSATDYHILDPSDDLTGMAWTCDEFPPAMSIEGGNNPSTGLANTYCAPQSAPDCDGKVTKSEQDFQSYAHGMIRQQNVASGTNAPYTGAYEFHFITEFDGSDDSWATRVDYYVLGGNGDFGAIYGITEPIQRRADRKILVSHRMHGNGTVMQLARVVEMDHGMPGGRHEFDAFAADRRGMQPVATRYMSSEASAAPAERLGRRDDVCTTMPAIPSLTDAPGSFGSSTFATATCSVQSVATIVGHS